ncbi:MAG TPA: MFS transporter [Candidatus Dormibacteraeota bacterium]|nr:MFS transporter [Candidatus Dormibacteraeota bacterium]
MPAAKRSALPIYVAAGSVFAALAARGFALPLRVSELGGDKIQVGLLFSVVTITAAGLSLPAGFVSDRFGKRKVLVFAIIVGGASQLGLGLATTVAPMYFWQALAGVGGAASQAALMAALIDVVPESRLGRAMGWLTLAFQVGFLVGPAAAGVALEWVNLQAVITASTGLYAVALVMTLIGVPSRSGVAIGWNIAAPLRQITRQRAFAAASIGMLGATLLWGTLQAYLPLFAKEQLRLPPSQIGYLIAIQAVANGLARIPGGRLVDRLTQRGPLVVLGLAVYSASVAVLPHMTGFWPTTTLLVASVPLLATTYLALGVIFSNLSTAETRGAAMGLYGTMLFLGLGVGSATFGTLMEHSGYVAGFTACAAAGLASAAGVALLRWAPFVGSPPARPEAAALSRT